MTSTKTKLFTDLENVINTLNIQSISEERKAILKPLVDFIQSKKINKKDIRINFICTHNSRRSHLSQVWAQVMAFRFNIQNVYCYSGGTEPTELFPMVAETLRNTGFLIKTISERNNPIHTIKYSDNEQPVIGFSKKFDDDFNPKTEFVAILTCSQADEGCPFISGAEKRKLITYEDPKAFDNSTQQTNKYNERSLQIATEMLYVFSQVK